MHSFASSNLLPQHHLFSPTRGTDLSFEVRIPQVLVRHLSSVPVIPTPSNIHIWAIYRAYTCHAAASATPSNILSKNYLPHPVAENRFVSLSSNTIFVFFNTPHTYAQVSLHTRAYLFPQSRFKHTPPAMYRRSDFQILQTNVILYNKPTISILDY